MFHLYPRLQLLVQQEISKRSWKNHHEEDAPGEDQVLVRYSQGAPQSWQGSAGVQARSKILLFFFRKYTL